MINLLFALALTANPEVKPATNPTCPVLGQKVTDRSKTVVVRGQEYRICCADCDSKLKKDPDNYLNEDGTPKNLGQAPVKPTPGHAGHGGHMH